MIEYGAIGLYWERCGIDKNCKSLIGTSGKILLCISLLGTFRQSMTLQIPNWIRCGRIWHGSCELEML